jgi:hypothetical protein
MRPHEAERLEGADGAAEADGAADSGRAAEREATAAADGIQRAEEAPDTEGAQTPEPTEQPLDRALQDEEEDFSDTTPRSAALAARLSAELAREEAATARTAAGTTPTGTAPGQAAPSQSTPDIVLWDDRTLPLFPLQPPRTARELLTDHITAMVCCAAMDTAGAAPGLDWLDGPSLLVNGERTADLAPRVLNLVEDGDPAPLRAWLARLGIRPEKPVRLV